MMKREVTNGCHHAANVIKKLTIDRSSITMTIMKNKPPHTVKSVFVVQA